MGVGEGEAVPPPTLNSKLMADIVRECGNPLMPRHRARKSYIGDGELPHQKLHLGMVWTLRSVNSISFDLKKVQELEVLTIA